jgi:hypothetical protein
MSGFRPRGENIHYDDLRAALKKYGGHTANCAYHLSHYKGPVSDCDCGWTAFTLETIVKCPECCCSYVAGSDHASVCPDNTANRGGKP